MERRAIDFRFEEWRLLTLPTVTTATFLRKLEILILCEFKVPTS